MKAFYIHGQRVPNKQDTVKQKALPRGFTCYITGHPDKSMVFVSTGFCSYKDQFVKTIGRDEAQKAPLEEIHKKDLPKYLAERYNKLYLWPAVFEDHYHYVWRYLF